MAASPSTHRTTRLLSISAVVMALGAMVLVSQGHEPLASRLFAMLMVLIEGLIPVVLWWTAAAGWGVGLRRVVGWRHAAEAGRLGEFETTIVGGAAMTLAMWLAGWAGALNAPTAWAIGGVGWASLLLAARAGSIRWTADAWPAAPWSIMLAAPAAGLLVATTCFAPGGLWASEFGGYDVLSYHLQLPREWITRGTIVGLEHNVYSYFPSLWETAYTQLALWQGSVIAASYAAQLLHATMALAAAIVVGRIVTEQAGGSVLGGMVGAIYLAVPWTIVTGSLAYNEQAMMALGAVVLAWTLRPTDTPLLRGGLIGVACALATLCKLTAAGFIALPIGVVMLLGWRPDEAPLRRVVGLVAGFAAVFTLFLIRNAIWTGNPVFPMFAPILGTGHWTLEQAQRWNANVNPPGGLFTGLRELGAAMFTHRQFAYVFWPAVTLGSVFAVVRSSRRRLAGLLIAMLVVQLGMWVTLTHHQSRFLLPLLLPGMGLLGLGLNTIGHRAALALGIMIAATATATSFAVYYDEPTNSVYYIDGVELIMEPGLALPNAHNTVNALPPGARVYAEGFATPMYTQRPVTYHTVWDQSPIGPALSQGGVSGALAWLREHGFTHVLIDWVMLERWHRPGNYGYDPRVPVQAVRALAGVLEPIRDLRGQTLFAVPGRAGQVPAPMRR